LNNVLGREVYTSNLQLGGTQIMYRNGVSHMTASDDFAGVSKIVKWISFVPKVRGESVPISPSADSWNRDVAYYPPQKQAYDVRWLIGGKEDEDGFQGGLFDRGSFEEALGGWARTVVVGRARLGGIPIGVIGVEIRAIENVTPADPANQDSTEQVTSEAGGVWYPNSAFKTAQAIKDFNNGEHLPLMILANWRGFSGGQRDMYNEVLKYGSYIVDALVKFEQPVFIYIPPHGELRGGSWVVVDPTINPDYMEMYADEEARAGVLEPEGIIVIKYKKERIQATMERLDPAYADLKRRLNDPNTPRDDLAKIKVNLNTREQQLKPIYTQIAIQFADLHDRAGRMAAKGAIRMPLQWRNARRFFHWRLRRRLGEETILKKMAGVAGAHGEEATSRKIGLDYLRAWSGIEQYDVADEKVAKWCEGNGEEVQKKIDALKKDGIKRDVAALMGVNLGAVLESVKNGLDTMPLNEKEKILRLLGSSKP
jgi:acetyl-CoA carboxylase/biotin carboxylase 1